MLNKALARPNVGGLLWGQGHTCGKWGAAALGTKLSVGAARGSLPLPGEGVKLRVG